MSHVKIKRYERDVSITLHTATTLATTLRLDDMAGGVVNLATISTNATSLQMWGARQLTVRSAASMVQTVQLQTLRSPLRARKGGSMPCLMLCSACRF